MDRNKNGCIEYSEFLLGTIDIASILEKKSIKNLFNEIDKNQDGFIDEEEIKAMMQDCSYSVEGLIAKLTEKKEKPNKGKLKISLKEFEDLIKNLYHQGKFQGF